MIALDLAARRRAVHSRPAAVNRKAIKPDAFRRTYLQLDPRTLGAGADRLRAGADRRSAAPRPVDPRVLQQRRRAPQPHGAVAPAGARGCSRSCSCRRCPRRRRSWFAICFFCFFCFLIGWRTRLFHVLSFVMTTSLHNRILFAENWGGVAIGALMVWTVFLPLGRRFSVDARAGQHARAAATRRPRTWRPGVPRARQHARRRRWRCWGCCCRSRSSTGSTTSTRAAPTWKHGTRGLLRAAPGADRHLAGAVGARARAVFGLTKLMTLRDAGRRGGGAVPGADADLLARGRGCWRWCCWSGLHLSIAAMVNLGIFSAAMLAFYPFLLDGAHLAAGRRGWCRAGGRARTVFYDVDCGVCFFIGARAGAAGRAPAAALALEPRPDGAARPASTASCSTGRSWWSTRDDAGPPLDARRRVRADLRARCRSGGCGRGRCACPGLQQLAGAAYDRVRAQPDAHLDLAGAGGVRRAGRAGAPAARRRSAEPTPLRAWLRARRAAGARAGHRAGVRHPGGRGVGREPRGPARRCASTTGREWMVAAVMYPHIFQGWSLFSPEAPLSDETVVRRRRDPRRPPRRSVQRGRQPRRRRCRSSGVPVRLGHDSFWCDYTLRIPDARQYHQALLEWILRYPERTGRPEDADRPLRGVRASGRTARSRARREPTNFRKRRFLRWPESE